jgi:hypothetical protein
VTLLAVNNAETQVATTVVTPAGSGGALATAFDEVVIGAGMAITHEAANAAHGSNSFRIAVVTPPTAVSYLGWSNVTLGSPGAQLYGAVYLTVHGTLASTVRLLGFYLGSTLLGYLGLVNNYQGLQWRTAGDVASGNVSGALVADTLYRIEWAFNAGGAALARVFAANTNNRVGADAVPAAGFLGTTVDHVRYGCNTASFSATAGDYLALDDFNVNTDGLPGPGPYSVGYFTGGSTPAQQTPGLLTFFRMLHRRLRQ